MLAVTQKCGMGRGVLDAKISEGNAPTFVFQIRELRLTREIPASLRALTSHACVPVSYPHASTCRGERHASRVAIPGWCLIAVRDLESSNVSLCITAVT